MHGLRIYPVILEVLVLLRPVIAVLARHDRDLTDQLRRAAASVALNAAEGSGSRGGVRQQRYRTALGSAGETSACIEVAIALGYLERVDDALVQKLTHVRATLARLVRRVRRGAPMRSAPPSGVTKGEGKGQGKGRGTGRSALRTPSSPATAASTRRSSGSAPCPRRCRTP